MQRNISSDLALENYKNENNSEFECIDYSESDLGYCNIVKQTVLDKLTNKINSFVTVYFDRIILLDDFTLDMLSETVAKEIYSVISKCISGKERQGIGYLVVGLGNSELTADAIGPITVRNITVTRHMSENNNIFTNISAIAPNVLSKTGIEAAEFVKAITERIRPDVVIVVDALAAKSCDRLGSTVQISDIGITPGSGIGNIRKAINSENIGCPVISIGVPTVVDSATLVIDTLEKAGVTQIDDNLFNVLKKGKSFFVTPKESDEITKISSKLIADALNLMFGFNHKSLSS